MKICIKCNENKDLNRFWKDISYHDGYCNTCKACKSEYRRNKPRIDHLVSVKNFECFSCKINKPSDDFHRNKRKVKGIESVCKECRRDISKNDYKTRKETIKQKARSYYEHNKETILKAQLKRQKERLKEDPRYALTRRLRNRLYYALKNKSWKKDTHFSDYIGCDQEFLVKHIENQFKDGMTWDNKGLWDIDHIIPLSSATTQEEMYKLCHYTNLQPLWTIDNIKKGNKSYT